MKGYNEKIIMTVHADSITGALYKK